LKKKVAQMQQEAERLDEIQKEVEAQMSGGNPAGKIQRQCLQKFTLQICSRDNKFSGC